MSISMYVVPVHVLSAWWQGVHSPRLPPPLSRLPLASHFYPGQAFCLFPPASKKAHVDVLHAQRDGEVAPYNQRAPFPCVHIRIFLFRQDRQGGVGRLQYYISCLIRSLCSGSL